MRTCRQAERDTGPGLSGRIGTRSLHFMNREKAIGQIFEPRECYSEEESSGAATHDHVDQLPAGSSGIGGSGGVQHALKGEQ